MTLQEGAVGITRDHPLYNGGNDPHSMQGAMPQVGNLAGPTNVGGDKPQPPSPMGAPTKQPELVESSARGKRYTAGVNHAYEQAGQESPLGEGLAGSEEQPKPASPVEIKAPTLAPKKENTEQ